MNTCALYVICTCVTALHLRYMRMHLFTANQKHLIFSCTLLIKEAGRIKHTMIRWRTIVHKINELPCCRFYYIKWGCLQQNKTQKTFFITNFTFWHLEDAAWNFHPGKTPHGQYNNMYNNTIHLEELQLCYYNFLQNWNCVNPFTPKSD